MNLTGLTYAWITTTIVCGILGEWVGGGWTELWRVLLAGLFLALLWEGLLFKRLVFTVAREVPAHGSLGEALHGHLAVTNPGSRPLLLETQQLFPDGMAGEDELAQLQVPAGATALRPFTTVPTQLGTVEWGAVYTRSLGGLGLAWWPRRVDVRGTVQVVPSHLRHQERGIGVQDLGELSQKVAGTGKELLWLREYRQGDPLRAIDWKATARRNRHIVRVLTEEQHLELMLLIDAGRASSLQAGALTRLHHFANVAARLAEKAVCQGDLVGLVVFAEQPLRVLPPVKGHAGLMKIRSLLEALRPSTREANPLPATLAARGLLKRRSLVVTFTETDDSDAAGQLLQATSLLSPKHLPLVAGIIDPAVTTLHHAPAQQWLDPYHAFAAAESLQVARRNALHLQRMGAQVAVTSPERLDEAVLTHYQRLRERKRV